MARAQRLLGWARHTVGRLVRVVPNAGGAYSRDRCKQLAAAISYHALFSLLPLLTLIVSIAGLVLRDDQLREDFIASIIDRFPLSPEAESNLEQILTNIPTPASAIGLLSLIGLLWSASGMMGALRVGLTAAFAKDVQRPYFQNKLVDVIVVLGFGFLLLVSFGLTVLVRVAGHYSTRLADLLAPLGFGQGGPLSIIVPLALTLATFVLLYHFVPPSRPRLGDVIPGALLGTVAFELLKIGFAFYVTNIANYDAVYGSLGTVIAFLFFVYLAASVLLFGAELAAEWPRAPETEAADASAEEPGPWYRKALRAVRGLFVRD